jgi:rhamnosyltransferase
MSKHETVKATVFIPTFNGEKYIGKIIKKIFDQTVDFGYELLIIDSGSTDRTLEIIRQYQTTYPNLRLHEIPNEEFGHGKTRNLAAQMANGEFIVYLSHDAIPANRHWLYEILKPFELSDKVVAVMGKQRPRRLCPPLLKYEIIHTFNNFGPGFGTTLFYKDDFINKPEIYDAVRFYSDVNSATRTAFLKNQIPYRDVRYSEDMMFGEDVIEAGYIKAYASRGEVIHSNDLTLKEYAPRMYDETMGMRVNGAPMRSLKAYGSLRAFLRGTIGDSIRILRDRNYSLLRKLYWLFVNPLFRIQKTRGIRAALRVSLDDDAATEKYSLEAISAKKHKK